MGVSDKCASPLDPLGMGDSDQAGRCWARLARLTTLLALGPEENVLRFEMAAEGEPARYRAPTGLAPLTRHLPAGEQARLRPRHWTVQIVGGRNGSRKRCCRRGQRQQAGWTRRRCDGSRWIVDRDCGLRTTVAPLRLVPDAPGVFVRRIPYSQYERRHARQMTSGPRRRPKPCPRS
jgi:hypothetical protein